MQDISYEFLKVLTDEQFARFMCTYPEEYDGFIGTMLYLSSFGRYTGVEYTAMIVRLNRVFE